MKIRALLFGWAGLGLASTLCAQFDLHKLSQALDTAQHAGKMLKGMAGIGPEEERAIGDSVALEIIARYGGLVRDEAVTRRVTLVGRSLAAYSDRPGLAWRFGVLDSATINAFSAPDGYVFITRGLYTLAESDDVLAAILGHEIAHITGRHALKIIARGEFLSGAVGFAAARSSDVRKADQQLKQFNLGVEQVTKTLFEKGFDPQTEYAADQTGQLLATSTGYASNGLRLALTRLQQHGGDPHAIFSTHPPLAERIKRLPANSALGRPASPTAPAASPAGTPGAEASPAPTAPAPLSEDDDAFFQAAEKPRSSPAKKKSAEWDDG